jgi:hypothetical protein
MARDAKSQQQGSKNTISESRARAPRNVVGVQAGKWGTKALGEAIFISMLATAQRIPIQRLSPKNKGALP